MIKKPRYIKKLNEDNYYFDFCTTSVDEIIKFADLNKLNYYIDGFEWSYNNKIYKLVVHY